MDLSPKAKLCCMLPLATQELKLMAATKMRVGKRAILLLTLIIANVCPSI